MQPSSQATPERVETDLAVKAREAGTTSANTVASSIRCRAPSPGGRRCRCQYFTKHQALPKPNPRRPLCVDGATCQALPVRMLSRRGVGVQPLRSWQPLLQRLRAQTTHQLRARSWKTLPSQPTWPSCPCAATTPLAGKKRESDASGFPTPRPACSTVCQRSGHRSADTTATLAVSFLWL